MTESQTAFAQDIAALVRDAQRGRSAARDQLITGHLSLIYNIVGRALNGHPDVDDLVQDTMLQAINGLGSLRDPDRFRSWLVAIAYRRVHMHLRSRKMTLLRRHPEPVDVPDPVGDFAERTTAELVVAEQRRELAEATRWLEDRDRELLGLWWQEARGDLTRAELAAALELNPKHAAVRVQRMKAQLDLSRGVVRALRAKPLCPELQQTIRFWDGTADSVWRKRLARHVRDCPRCRVHQGGMVTPERLLLGIAALPVPVALWAGIQAAAAGGAAVAPSALSGVSLVAHVQSLASHKGLAAAAVAATVAVGGGLTYAVVYEPERPAALGPSLTITSAPGTAAASRPAAPAVSEAPSAAATARPVAGLGVPKADIYVSPGGSDDGDGSLARPYASIAKAVATVRPGQTIALRGGTHRLTSPITISTSGTAEKRVTISGYGGERAVIDASAVPADKWAITQRSSYWTMRDLEITGAPDAAYTCLSCRDNVYLRLSVHDNGGTGIMLRDPGTAANQVLDSDFYANRGSGLAVQFGDGDGNRLRGNRSFRNGGDGINLGAFDSRVSVQYNWSYANGANGFAVGGGTPAVSAAHQVRHNAAWGNDGHGFVDEGNTGAIELGNNTAFRNTGLGFAITTAPAVLRNNAAIGNERGEQGLSAAAKPTGNSWQVSGFSEATFRSVDPAVAEGARTAAAKLPGTDYLSTGNGVGASMSGS
ncbi:sigma-70 family RNA polymerase sigma factor [Actinoplanes flavus]|uniref:RNA polymerase sigma factor n=1 Tax=Actinoplanes flavus TaxID=2820290 RepID=A0ABS3UE20_9ACTN|nr:sigma-70 family RNA polymerase sigma factor [Actinoplanes flavus]MBO3737020.1 sigma-70 family RNA polymerase sigma factor [Actinoplanes flavus]